MSPPPLSVPTTQPTVIELENSICWSLPPPEILGQKATFNVTLQATNQNNSINVSSV